jgi:hypothetical protein
VLPAAWTSVLERIQRALEQTIAAVGARQQALDREADGATAEGASASQRLLEQLQAHNQDHAGHPQQATEQIEQVEAALGSTEEALKRWLSAAGQAAQRLADPTGRRV